MPIAFNISNATFKRKFGLFFSISRKAQLIKIFGRLYILINLKIRVLFLLQQVL